MVFLGPWPSSSPLGVYCPRRHFEMRMGAIHSRNHAAFLEPFCVPSSGPIPRSRRQDPPSMITASFWPSSMMSCGLSSLRTNPDAWMNCNNTISRFQAESSGTLCPMLRLRRSGLHASCSGTMSLYHKAETIAAFPVSLIGDLRDTTVELAAGRGSGRVTTSPYDARKGRTSSTYSTWKSYRKTWSTIYKAIV